MVDRNTLFDCLVAWVNTFNLNVKCDGANDLKDGIVIAKCLNNIDPEYFDEEWLSKIKNDTNENCQLKLLNLKKILQRITDYYSEVLNHSLSDFEMPNLNLIVETNNNTTNVDANNQLSHLLQLALGCAVNCERKSEFIKNIMEMNESTQHMIMTAIQELMSKDRNMSMMRQSASSLSIGGGNAMSGSMMMLSAMNSSGIGIGGGLGILGSPGMIGPNNNNNNNMINTSHNLLSSGGGGGGSDEDVSYQLKKAFMEIGRLNELREDIELKCKRLDKQVSELQDEKITLVSEIDMLREKLQREDLSRNDLTNDINKQIRLQQNIDIMQEELYRLESEKEKYRIQFEAAKSEQDILIEKNCELKKLAQEHQNLRDEIDVLKHRSDKVEKLESTIESYKIKLEEMVDLKRQIKSLEENNTKYLEKILVMEEEVKKTNALRSQIDMYKKQIQELHEQMLNGEMKSKKLEYEYKSVEEQLSTLRVEKDRLQLDYERLKDNLDKINTTGPTLLLDDVMVNSTSGGGSGDENLSTEEEQQRRSMSHHQLFDDIFTSTELMNVPSDIKEKLIRLCHENKVLKSKQSEYNDERFLLVQAQLDDEKQRAVDLQARLNETSKQKIEIECQLNDLRKKEVEQQQSTTTAAATNAAADSSREMLLNDLKEKLARAQAKYDDECKRSEKSVKSLEEKIEALIAEKNELRESKEREVQTKEKEIKEMYEKYRAYLEKAKIVIKTLDPRNSTNGSSEVQFLKAQLVEKEKQIKTLTKENDRIRNSRDQEERMLVSAWYKLGAQLNRRVTDERISSVGSSSFLSQQRHLPNLANTSALITTTTTTTTTANPTANQSSSSSSSSSSSTSSNSSSSPIGSSISANNTPKQRSNNFLASLAQSKPTNLI